MKTLPRERPGIGPRISYSLRSGLTLIELLIVVMIIAILASIAVVNVLEAQTRAKVSGAKAAMRTASIGLESFFIDNNRYPELGLPQLTAPVQYLQAAPKDIFMANEVRTDPGYIPQDIRYGSMPLINPIRYVIASVGPDRNLDEYFLIDGNLERNNFALQLYPGYSVPLFFGSGVQSGGLEFLYVVYDPTNGTISGGDIFRSREHIFE